MKNTILAVTAAAAMVLPLAAQAADLPVKAPIYKAPPPVAVFSWTGCYIGGHGGWSFGHKQWSDPAVGGFVFAEHDVDGGMAGGQIGCDYQTGSFVFGIEGSASWADITGDSLDALSPGGNTLRDHSKIDFIGTIAGRLGWAWDRTLLYVKGGGAVVNDSFRATCDQAVGACAGLPIGTTFASSQDNTRWGWLVGAGIEYAFTNNWSAKVEYNYMDFGRDSVTFAGPIFAGPAFPFDIDQHVHVVKGAINYRFNWGGPVVARY
jgi:outer membrane immunogenic protein